MDKWIRFQRADGSIGFGRVLPGASGPVQLPAGAGAGAGAQAALPAGAADADSAAQAMRNDLACEAAGAQVEVFSGNLFNHPAPTGECLALASLTLLMPVTPSKMIGLWNNFHAAAQKNGNSIPAVPLYFLKAPNAWLAHGQPIEAPAHYDGRVVYEGELGIVIGQRCRAVSEEAAAAAIFGYTCINDMTALSVIEEDASFAQWTRAKSFDTFGPVGPCIATGVDWSRLVIRTRVNGRERQNYPASDMIISPAQIISLISRDLTLEPGDIIACGTSVGVLPVKPGTRIDVTIDGIGTLSNLYG